MRKPPLGGGGALRSSAVHECGNPGGGSRSRRFGAVIATAAFTILSTVVGLAGAPSPAGAQGSEASANERWLRDAYTEIFGRPADGGGLDFWLGRLATGGDERRTAVARTMLFSPEGAGNEVDRAYDDLLGRGAEPGGRAFWTEYLQTRPVTELRTNILASPERFEGAGSPAAWITELYQELLGRSPDAGGLAYWVGMEASGAHHYWIVDAIYQSDESLGGRVTAYYLEIFERSPTAAERDAGVEVIRADNERVLRAELLGSDEAFEPFLRPDA